MNAPASFPQPIPKFVRHSHTEADVYHGGEAFTAYFRTQPAPVLTGLVRHDDELPMDRTYAVYWVGADTVARWEADCAERDDEQDDDHEAQAGYDAAREAGL